MSACWAASCACMSAIGSGSGGGGIGRPDSSSTDSLRRVRRAAAGAVTVVFERPRHTGERQTGNGHVAAARRAASESETSPGNTARPTMRPSPNSDAPARLITYRVELVNVPLTVPWENRLPTV